MIQLTLDKSHDRNYWRFTRYNSAGDTSLVCNQIMPHSMHLFRDAEGSGMIIGTDHGKECWHNQNIRAVYDLHWMLDIAKSNVKPKNRGGIIFDTLENFEPFAVEWLKCADHELVVDLLCNHKDWLYTIPKIVIQRCNQWNQKRLASWDKLFSPETVLKIAQSHLSVLNRGTDYGNEEEEEKGRQQKGLITTP